MLMILSIHRESLQLHTSSRGDFDLLRSFGEICDRTQSSVTIHLVQAAEEKGERFHTL